jgi:hypothetical protein
MKYNGREIGRTPIIKGSLHPVWSLDHSHNEILPSNELNKQKCRFDVFITKTSMLYLCNFEIELYDSDVQGKQTDFLGMVKLQGGDLVTVLESGKSTEFPLQKSKRLSEGDNRSVKGMVIIRGQKKEVGDFQSMKGSVKVAAKRNSVSVKEGTNIGNLENSLRSLNTHDSNNTANPESKGNLANALSAPITVKDSFKLEGEEYQKQIAHIRMPKQQKCYFYLHFNKLGIPSALHLQLFRPQWENTYLEYKTVVGRVYVDNEESDMIRFALCSNTALNHHLDISAALISMGHQLPLILHSIEIHFWVELSAAEYCLESKKIAVVSIIGGKIQELFIHADDYYRKGFVEDASSKASSNHFIFSPVSVLWTYAKSYYYAVPQKDHVLSAMIYMSLAIPVCQKYLLSIRNCTIIRSENGNESTQGKRGFGNLFGGKR